MMLSRSLVGLRVEITLEEDGTPSPPVLPLGTIVRGLTGTDREVYHLVVLDHPVRCLRGNTGHEWWLHNLVVGSRHRGSSLEQLVTGEEGTSIVVGIANALVPIEPDDLVLDFSKVEYFGIGLITRA